MMARIYTALGERHDALNWLETAYQQRAPLIAFNVASSRVPAGVARTSNDSQV